MTDEKQSLVPKDDAPAGMLAVIERAARDNTVDVGKMRELLSMHREIVREQEERDFIRALADVQARIGRIEPDKQNKIKSNWWVSYVRLDRVLRPLCIEAGLSLSFTSAAAPEGMVKVVCYVSHKSGHTRTYEASVPSDGKGDKGGDVMSRTHAFGSGMSYGKRYLLLAIFNIAVGIDAEDDDGNSATIAADADVVDPITDKITLSETCDELRKMKAEIVAVKVSRKAKQALMQAYNLKLRQLTGKANANG